MPKQSKLDRVGIEPGEPHSQAPEQENTSVSQSTNDVSGNITYVTPDEEIEEWKAELPEDAHFAYIALEARIRPTLEGVQTEIGYRTSTPGVVSPTHSVGGAQRQPILQAVRWYVDYLAHPFIDPERQEAAEGELFGRPVPAERVRIFVPDEVLERVSMDCEVAEGLLEHLESIPDFEATDEVVRLYRRCKQYKQWCCGRSPLASYKKAITNTIRARLGFTGRFGGSGRTVQLPHKTIHGVPEPDEQFEDWSLDGLADELTATRECIAMAEERRDNLRSEVKDTHDNLYDQLVLEHLYSYKDKLLDREDA